MPAVGVSLVAAAGNQGSIGYISLLNHRWIIPVSACNEVGQRARDSNFGAFVGTHGLMVPGVNIVSTAPGGRYSVLSGTSVATPFVTGTIALLWSLFPKATPKEIIGSLKGGARGTGRMHRSIVPALLNAEASWKLLNKC